MGYHEVYIDDNDILDNLSTDDLEDELARRNGETNSKQFKTVNEVAYKLYRAKLYSEEEFNRTLDEFFVATLGKKPHEIKRTS